MIRALAVGVAVLATAAAASAAPGNLQITEGGARFPFRAFVLTVPPGTRVDPATVRVTENGDGVANASLIPATDARAGSFGVVLVMDSSDSMAGRPIAAAVEAARAFGARRFASQQLGVVTFNTGARVALPLTTQPTRIARVLAHAPKLAYGTQLYDAVGRAVTLLKDAKVSSGAVVLLSDGADTGSRLKEADALSAAARAHVRVFTVGLRSSAFDRGAMQALAAGTGGSFSAADAPADLARIYDALGERLAREYLLQYRSLAGPAARVAVRVELPGLKPAVSGYVTPELPSFGGPFRPSLLDRLWSSWVSMLAAALLSAALLGVALGCLLRPPPRNLQRRVSEFVSLYTPSPQQKRQSAVAAGADRSLRRSSRWRRFGEELVIADIAASPMQVVLFTAGLSVLVGWLAAALFGSALFAAFGLLVPIGVRSLINRSLRRKRLKFADQLPDTLQVVASALRAGHSIVGAMAVVANQAAEPSGSELRRAVADEQLGIPLEDALGAVATRMASREFEQVAIVAALQRDSGGNSAEVLDRVGESVREKIQLRQLIASLTAQGRLARWVLTLLPPAFGLLISVLSPGFLSPLLDRTLGRLIIVAACISVVIGSLLIKRIVEIEV
jgi:tight adherence protein B